MEMQTPATSANTTPDPADIAIAQAEARQRRRRRWLIVVGVAALILSYPLSVGPLDALERKGWLPPAVCSLLPAYYSPLRWLYERNEMVKMFYDFYLGFNE